MPDIMANGTNRGDKLMKRICHQFVTEPNEVVHTLIRAYRREESAIGCIAVLIPPCHIKHGGSTGIGIINQSVELISVLKRLGEKLIVRK